ncbi:glycosyltransferase [Bradyrhizobium sp. Tv2a-2]|uniref:glycosyltransferase n=1 Tax=Bradyrhizobium sp. Tv2a-2 TaxID=113395 RepID=UPI0003F508F4|nr:glycosyltransferase [Bradyrhizobium sp. Tv2a-2]
MTIYVDHTHLGRHVTGLERVTLELFSRSALAPLDVVPVTARGSRQMILRQTFRLPLRLATSSSLLLCPGFPPSPLLRPFAARVLPYIHDIFLLSRPADLNLRARLYMAAPFRLALRRYPRFLTNSNDTREKLAAHCRPDAAITLYRPPVRNVFGLNADGRADRQDHRRDHRRTLRLVALGTVEPRKNFLAAAKIAAALRSLECPNVTLDILGRRGWGEDWDILKSLPGVTLHGYRPDDRVRALLTEADIFICTSHEEGLGLPLLEAQYAGLPIVAPDAAIFREVLGQSGIFVDPSEPKTAATTITGMLADGAWRSRYVALGTENLARWNALARADRDAVVTLIARLARDGAPAPAPHRADRIAEH